MMKNAPMPTLTSIQVFALREASRASWYLPAFQLLSTWAEKIMAGIPNGRQQNMVAKMDKARKFFGFGPTGCCWTGWGS